MIKVVKQTEIPQILVDNAAIWRDELLAKIEEIKEETDKTKLKKLN
jgi:hypothetical protein